MPSLKDVIGNKDEQKEGEVTRAIAHSGLLRLNPDWDLDGDDDEDEDMDCDAEDFTASMSKEILEKYRLDVRDFPELKWHYNMNPDVGQGNSSSNFNDAMSARSF